MYFRQGKKIKKMNYSWEFANKTREEGIICNNINNMF